MDEITKITVPQENVNDEFATVISWFVSSGDKVDQGQEIVDLETSKATFSVSSPTDGFLYYNAKEGTDVAVGSVLCFISPAPLDDSKLTKLFEEIEVPTSLQSARIGAPESEDTGKPFDLAAAQKADAKGEVKSHIPARFSRGAMQVIKNAGIDPEIFRGQGLVSKRDVLDYLSKREKMEALEAQKRRADPAKLWVIHDEEPTSRGFGLYSKEFVRRIVGGAYGGGEVVGWRKIVADICWYLHFVAFGLIWLCAKLPVISSWLEIIARIYKRNMFGFFLRGAYYKAKLKEMGTDVIIDQGVEIWGPKNVRIGPSCHLDMNACIAAGESGQSQHGWVDIGAHVHIGPNTHLAGRGGVKIGSYTAITAGSKIFSATNVGDNPSDPTDLLPMSHAAPLHRQRIVEAPVIIEDYVFVGLNVCILPGVKIGRGAIINSGALIAQDIEPFQVIKGATMSTVGTRLPRKK